MSTPHILYVAPYIDGHSLGEGYFGFRLVEEMTRLAKVTVLAFESRIGPPLAEQLPEAEVITFQAPGWINLNERISAMLKPHIPVLHAKAATWLRKAQGEGRRFDIAHQILPAAPRYPSPLAKFDIPYVFGPLGGALPTPKAFQDETGGAPLFTRLRAVDALRFRHDPWLRRSYARADLVLGVAPYMRDLLSDVPLKRFEPFLGIGLNELPDLPPEKPARAPGSLRMLHVGRAVRTKGLRDTVRALAHLKDLPDVTLTSAGGGEEIGVCRAEAERLGVADRVRFLGAQPRDAVEALYGESDALVFPSFRESMGAVLYEAMAWELPVITVSTGGPDWIVNERSGLKVPLTTPEQMPLDLAGKIRELANDPALGRTLGQAGRARLKEEALWPVKARELLGLYESVLTGRKQAA